MEVSSQRLFVERRVLKMGYLQHRCLACARRHVTLLVIGLRNRTPKMDPGMSALYKQLTGYSH